MNRLVIPIDRQLAARPPDIESCFELINTTLQKADQPDAPFALFGGAIRDTDYAAYHGEYRPVNDYDVRIWLAEDDHEQRLQEFAASLGSVSVSTVRETPTFGSHHIRYCFEYRGAELDISVRPPKNTSLDPGRVAIERAGDSDAGLSSVAIAQDGSVWATPEYLNDRNNRTTTIYHRPNAERRLREYTERMQVKFPDHQIIKLSEV